MSKSNWETWNDQPDDVNNQWHAGLVINYFFAKRRKRKGGDFKHCIPMGILMIVIHQSTPAANQLRPPISPPNMNQMTFPKQLIVFLLLLQFLIRTGQKTIWFFFFSFQHQVFRKSFWISSVFSFVTNVCWLVFLLVADPPVLLIAVHLLAQNRWSGFLCYSNDQ